MRKQTAKKLPVLLSDEDAERFVAESDLTQYDLSGGIPLSQFELQMKDASIHLRMPQGQLDQIKAEAERRQIPYQRFMRELIQRGMRSFGNS